MASKFIENYSNFFCFLYLNFFFKFSKKFFSIFSEEFLTFTSKLIQNHSTFFKYFLQFKIIFWNFQQLFKIFSQNWSKILRRYSKTFFYQITPIFKFGLMFCSFFSWQIATCMYPLLFLAYLLTGTVSQTARAISHTLIMYLDYWQPGWLAAKKWFPVGDMGPPKRKTWPPPLIPFWSRGCQNSRYFVPKYR